MAKTRRKPLALWFLAAMAAATPVTFPSPAASANGALSDAPRSRVAKPIRDLRGALEQTAAVVHARVTDLTPTYTEQDGPRTRIVLSDVRTLRGASLPKELVVSVFGGPLPEGDIVYATHVPTFLLGEAYVLFLRNTEWYITPTVADAGYSFRVVNAAGRAVMVDMDGNAVDGLSRAGAARRGRFFDTSQQRNARSDKALPVQGFSEELLAAEAIDVDSFVAQLVGMEGDLAMPVAGVFSLEHRHLTGNDWRVGQ